MRMIHIPRTGGLTIASQTNLAISHWPARAFPRRETWGVTRDPYERLVSILASEVNQAEPLPVEMFEAWVMKGMLSEVVNTGTVWELSFAAPQVCFVSPSTELFRFEEWDAVTEMVYRKTGVELDGRVLHKTEHLPAWEYYGEPQVRAAVEARYKVDFEAFGYPMDIRDRR